MGGPSSSPPNTSSNRSHTATHTATDGQTRMPNTRAPATPQGLNMYDWTRHTTATCGTYPRYPRPHNPPKWMPEDTPYTDRDKQYHYPTPIQQLATTLDHPANTELLRRLEDSVHTPLYYSALRLDSVPAHLQKSRLQLALEQLSLLTRYHRWYARRSIHIPARYTKCICGHAEEETSDHFEGCPLYRGLDTLTDWNQTHTIAQHAGWLTGSWQPSNSPASSSRRRYSRRSAGDWSSQLSTPCYAPTRRTPRPRRRTCNGRPVPRQRSSSHTAPTNTCSMQAPCPKRTKPTSSNSCSTNPENLPHDIPTRDPHHA